MIPAMSLIGDSTLNSFSKILLLPRKEKEVVQITQNTCELTLLQYYFLGAQNNLIFIYVFTY